METKSDDLTRISVAPPAIPSAPVPPAPTAQEIHEFEIKKLYHEVTDGLEKKNTRTSPLLSSLLCPLSLFLLQWAMTTL
jgi:hypothetical protein